MDFTLLYSTRIQTTFDEDQIAILKALGSCLKLKDGAKVTLTNYYKGLPIIYPATILGIEHGCVDLDISSQQAVAMAEDHYTLIRSKHLPFPVAASVQYVNVKKHAASLNKLCYVEVLAEKRTAVRLDLEPVVKATMQLPDGQELLSGLLMDISVQGIAVDVDSYADIENGTELSVKFMLPDPVLMKQTLVKVPAMLVAIAGNSSPYRYKFRIHPEKHQEQLISRYSFQRQVEIIKVLKDSVI